MMWWQTRYKRLKENKNIKKTLKTIKRAKWNLQIKYVIYTCIISLDGINSILDVGEVKLSELQSNQAKTDFF